MRHNERWAFPAFLIALLCAAVGCGEPRVRVEAAGGSGGVGWVGVGLAWGSTNAVAVVRADAEKYMGCVDADGRGGGRVSGKGGGCGGGKCGDK